MRALTVLLALVLLGLAPAVPAQDQPPPPAQDQPPPQPSPTPASTIVIKTKTNAGDFAYKPFYRTFRRILDLLPPPPRMLDPVLQMTFADITLAEQDGYLKDSWNVAIVGKGFELEVPTVRGGYYVPPAEDKVTAADATVMFNTSTRHNYVRVAWQLRLPASQTLSYQEFARAFAEITDLQAQIPWYSIVLREEKRAKFNGMKACFAEAGGAILVDGKPVPAIASANCLVLAFDPVLAAAAPQISLQGKVEIVVLEDLGRYRPQARP